MTLRKGRLTDIERVMDIKTKVLPLMISSGNTQWSEDYPDRERFTKDMEEGSLYVYDEDGIKGFVVVDDDHPEPYKKVSWRVPREESKAMHRMAVDPDAEGKGIAAGMLNAVERLVVNEGYKAVHTDTSLENEKMQHRFERDHYERRGKIRLDDNPGDWYAAYEKIFVCD